MPSDHLPRTPKNRLAKWPFWLGDGLLVVTGISLALAQDGGAINPVAMGIVVAAIALGGLLACAPYVIEHLGEAVRAGRGGDWAEIRNQVLKLEFRLAELELKGGGAPESARLAHGRWTENEDDLGVGEVIKHPKADEAKRDAPANPHFNFGQAGSAPVAAKAAGERGPSDAAQRAAEIRQQLELDPGPIDSETGVGPARPQRPKSNQPSSFTVVSNDAEEEDLPTSLDDLGPPETGQSAHLSKALSHAKKHPGNRHVQRLIQGGKRSAG